MKKYRNVIPPKEHNFPLTDPSPKKELYVSSDKEFKITVFRKPSKLRENRQCNEIRKTDM